MLVLTRKIGESIYISQDIQVKVLAIRGSTVKLGFAAPADVSIRREEARSLDDNPEPGESGKVVRDSLCRAAPS